MKGSFVSGATTSEVAKIGTKNYSTTVDKIITSGQIFVFGVYKLPYRSPDMMGSFSSGATASLVAKNGTKNYSTTVDKIITIGQISEFEVSKRPYRSLLHDGITCKWRH